MKTTLCKTIGVSPLAVWLAFLHVQSSFAVPGDGAPMSEPARASESIPWSEIGTKATAQYAGDSLSISAVEGGAVLRCVFQRLEGEATSEGLWLTSTVTNAVNNRFRVVASSVGREAGERSADLQPALERERCSRLNSPFTCPRAGKAQSRSQTGAPIAWNFQKGAIGENSACLEAAFCFDAKRWERETQTKT